ncbi:MAG: hypothetical protein WCK23_06025 [Actinomycetes bacterium]
MSNDGIEPDDLWAQTTAVPVTPPPSGTPTRQLVVIGASAFVVMLIVGLILTLSLGGKDSGTAIATTSTSSSTSVVSSTTVPASIVTTLVPITSEETTTTSSTTTTLVGLTTNQPITVASGLGINHIAEAKTTRDDNNSWAIAFRLADGTYIAQHVTPNTGQQGDSTIYRVGATTTVVKSAPNPGTDWIRLHDVYTESGSTFVLYSLNTNFVSTDAKEELFALDLNTGLTTSFSVVGGMNSGVSRLSYGNNIIVGEKFEEANAGPFFLNLDGYTTNPNDLGLADSYDNCTVCPSKFTVDPSGQRLAWVEADLLVVLDRTSASRIAEIPLPKGLYTSINSLDIFGDLILINIYDSNSGAMGKPILMSFAGTSTTLDTVGAATFDQ